jgi:ribosomal protein S17E
MESEDSSKYTLQGRELVEYLVHRAADDAKAALIERDERRNRRTGFIMSIVALIGVGSLVSALKIFVRSEVDVIQQRFKENDAAVRDLLAQSSQSLQNEFTGRIESSVSKAVEKKILDVQRTLEENDRFERYAELAQQLPEKTAGIHQRGDKFLTEALRETLEAAEQMAGVKRITKRGRFLMSTRQIVDVMTRFNRESEINRLDDLLGEVMATDQELARILVDHYGQLVIGSPRPVESLTDDMARLNRYLRAAQEQNYPEKALVWSLFTEFKRNGYERNETTDRLLESTKDLVDRDRAEFWFNLYVYTNPLNWMLAPDQQGRELARLMAALQNQYQANGITEVMEQNLANNPFLQTRLADLRAKNPAWQQQAAGEAVAEEPTTENHDATAGAPQGNALR